MFNNNECACSYAVGVGVLAFVACVVFPMLDIIISKISDATAKNRIVKGDLAFSSKSALTAMSYSSLKEQKSAKKGSAALYILKLSESFPLNLFLCFESPDSGYDLPVVHLLLCLAQPVDQN